MQQRNAVAEILGLLHEVRDEDHRHALVADALDQLPGLATRLRVEAGGQLVEDRQLWTPDQRERDRQALALSAGEVDVARVTLLLETQQRAAARSGATGSG